MTFNDCACAQDKELWICLDGEIYGPCENENCGGMCESAGKCDCECHT